MHSGLKIFNSSISLNEALDKKERKKKKRKRKAHPAEWQVGHTSLFILTLTWLSRKKPCNVCVKIREPETRIADDDCLSFNGRVVYSYDTAFHWLSHTVCGAHEMRERKGNM